MIDILSRRKKRVVYFPEELFEKRYQGDIFGYYHEETGIFNVTGSNTGISGSKWIGIISDIHNTDGLNGHWSNNDLYFSFGGDSYRTELYGLEKKLFSRNTGILETDWMLKKKAIIVGCGSVGSLVALELTRAGVGTFILVDSDTVEYSNLCRHQCGIQDVGSYKVSALKKRIQDINPKAKVEAIVNIVENLPKHIFDKYADKDTVFIGCADNRAADAYANDIAKIYNAAFVSIGFWERAFAGEIFYYLPENGMILYKDAFQSKLQLTGRVDANRHIYTMQTDIHEVNYEPGIAADIDYVSVIAVKLLLDILNRDNPTYIAKVIDSLTEFTLICNTNDIRIGGERAEIFSYPLQVTRNIKITGK